MRKTGKYLLVAFVAVVVVLFFGLKKNINLRGLHKYQSPHFTVYYEALNQQTLHDIEQKLETAFPGIQEFFGLNDDDRTDVIVYKTVGRFQRAYLGLLLSLVFGDWAAGAAYQHTLLLTSPENPGRQHTYEDMLDIAVHEYVHTQVYRVNENADIWLDEGLASYLAGQRSDFYDVAVPSFERMQSQSQGEFVENGGYTWGYSYVEFLVETYGAEKVVELVRTNDYEGSLGKSKSAVYDEWLAYLCATDPRFCS
jgi:hypothetical protein